MILAFLKRDLSIAKQYPGVLVLDIFNVFAQLLIFFFIGKMIPDHSFQSASYDSKNYFEFVLVGIALSGYQSAALMSLPSLIQTEQQQGTLEIILSTSIRIPQLILGSMIWPLIITSIKLVIYFLAGIFFFQCQFNFSNPLFILVTIFLTTLSLLGFGLLSSAYVILYKRGDPIGFFLNGFSRLFAGVYFPISILPAWLGLISIFLPLTYSLEALRKSLNASVSYQELLEPWIALLVTTLIMLPIGYFVLRCAICKAKQLGNLGFQ